MFDRASLVSMVKKKAN